MANRWWRWWGWWSRALCRWTWCARCGWCGWSRNSSSAPACAPVHDSWLVGVVDNLLNHCRRPLNRCRRDRHLWGWRWCSGHGRLAGKVSFSESRESPGQAEGAGHSAEGGQPDDEDRPVTGGGLQSLVVWLRHISCRVEVLALGSVWALVSVSAVVMVMGLAWVAARPHALAPAAWCPTSTQQEPLRRARDRTHLPSCAPPAPAETVHELRLQGVDWPERR